MKYPKFVIRLHIGSKENGKELKMMSNLYLSDYEHGGIVNNKWLESEVDQKQGGEMSMFLHIDGKFRWCSNWEKQVWILGDLGDGVWVH